MILEITTSIVISYIVITALRFFHFLLFALVLPKILRKYYDPFSSNLIMDNYWIYNALKSQTDKYQQPYEITVIHDDTMHK